MDAHEKVALEEKRLEEFEKYRAEYARRDREHFEARLNRGNFEPDVQHRIYEEMIFDVFKQIEALALRVAALEGILDPEGPGSK